MAILTAIVYFGYSAFVLFLVDLWILKVVIVSGKIVRNAWKAAKSETMVKIR